MASRREIAIDRAAWAAAFLLLLLGMDLSPSAARAQPLKEALEECLEIADERARLACFEDVARSSETSPPAQAVPAQQESEKSAFSSEPSADSAGSSSSAPAADTTGADLEPKDRFGLPEVTERTQSEDKRREMVILEARRLPRDKGVYIMENGQVWTLVSGTYRPIDPGTPVVIEEGWLGSHRMLVEDGWTYRVRRIR